MPTTYKVLGQSAPDATTDTSLYTVPSATQTIVSTIVVANRAASNATFRIAIRVNGASLADEQYLAYDITVGASDSTALTLGITLGEGDIISIYASNADLTFTAFGSEIS